ASMAAASDAFASSAFDAEPGNVQGYELLYRLHLREGDRDAARALVDRGVAAAPSDDGMKVMKADLLLGEGAEEEALVIYEDILTRRPRDQLVANNYASLMTKLRDDADSRRKAAEAARVLENADNGFFQDTLGWALVLNGEVERGVEFLEKAVEATPNLAEARYHLGAALIRNGDIERGKSELREAIERGGDNASFAADARSLLEQ
ncbi:MAG: tetratricopeptide repeat protein, partial [Pseudomonadota bacterium]